MRREDMRAGYQNDQAILLGGTDLLVHCVAAQLSASALDPFFDINLKPTALEERSGGQTRLREDPRYGGGAQGRLDVAIKTCCDPLTSKGRVRIEKVEVPVKLVGSETRNNAVMLRDDGVKRCEPLLPPANIRGVGSPSGKLLSGVERSGQRMNGRAIQRDDLFQVGWLIRTLVHR